MAEQTDPSCEGRTLVVILGTHRSGSSLTTSLLHRLGMSLGPFELIGPLDSNRHGHFEPVPINHFDLRLQRQIFGFDGDMPPTEEALKCFLQSDGQWTLDGRVSESDLEFGRRAIQQLVESGNTSGFKDPRLILLWPYWREVLSGFDGLRIVPLVLLRSPHEAAMSIFMRGNGRYSYHDALDVIAVNLRRLQEICRSWRGELAVVRFDPRTFLGDLSRAAETCHLAWDESVFKQVYDSSDRHHDPARVEHEAQRIFDELSALPQSLEAANGLTLARDGAIREKTIQSQIARCTEAIACLAGEFQTSTAGTRQQLAQLHADSQKHHVNSTRLTDELSKLAALGAAQSEHEQQRQAIEGQFSRDLVMLGEGLGNLANLVNSKVAHLQTLCDSHRAAMETMENRLQALEEHRAAMETMGNRLQALEEHPFRRAARCMNRAYHRLRKQELPKKVA
jgi:hypothetical protein